MFRSLATRLTATYVFAAIVLVVIVIAAVTAFSLSVFGISARETSDQVARQVPEEARLQISRAGSLRAAAADIARHIARPGLRVAVLEQAGLRFRPIAFAAPDRSGGPSITVVMVGRAPFGAAPPNGATVIGPGGPGGPGPGGRDPGGPAGGGPGNDPGAPPNSSVPGSFGGLGRRWERVDYPFSLNTYLHLEPRDVRIDGGQVTLIPDPGDLVRAINAFWIAMLWIGLFVVVAAWLLGRFIAGQALRPLVETTASLQRFGAGDFTPRPIEATSRDEIGELARAYNAAAAQVSAAFEERKLAELEMRQFIADAGHELRTPLTVIMGFVDVLRRRAQQEPASSSKIYDTMLDESRRMKTLIDKLIVLARLENAHVREFETVDLAQIAGSVATSLQSLGSGDRIELHSEARALVRGYESELHDAVSNLVENALKYAPESPVSVRVYGDAESVSVDVADRGPGIPADEQSAVFSRFYRGRDRSAHAEGFGLGLAIARRAVERAGGTLTLWSEPGRGSRFSIRIPRATRGESAVLA